MATILQWIQGGDGLDAATVAKYRRRASMPDGTEWLTKHGLPPLDQIIRTEPQTGSPKKPTLLQSALTLASVMAQTAKRGSLLDEATIAQRLAICQSCEHYTGTSCKLCGCGCGGAKKLTNKLAHAASSCDAGKWGPVHTNQNTSNSQ